MQEVSTANSVAYYKAYQWNRGRYLVPAILQFYIAIWIVFLQFNLPVLHSTSRPHMKDIDGVQAHALRSYLGFLKSTSNVGVLAVAHATSFMLST